MESETKQRAARPSNWGLVRRLLGLAWQYRLGCVKIVALQIMLLALGMLGLGLTGVGVDFIRYELAMRQAQASLEGPVSIEPAGATVRPGPTRPDTPTPSPKPPRWPFGVAPPADWPPMTVLTAIALAVLFFAGARSLLNMAYTIAVNRLLQGRIVVDLRARVFRKMQRLSFRFFDANASGGIINKVTGDVQSVRGFVDGVVIQSLILIISLVVYLFYMTSIHRGLTLASLAVVPLLWYVTAEFSRRVRPAYLRNRALFDDQVLALSESVQGVHVVKGFARQEQEQQKFDDAVDAVRDQKHWIFNALSTFQPLIGVLTQVGLVVLLSYGGYLVACYERAADAETASRVGLSIGQLLVFAGLLQQFSGQVANLATVADSMQQSLTGAERVFEVLDAPVEVKSPPEPVRLRQVRGDVEFRDVSFSYRPPDMALENVSFRVQPGQCVALLGATGAGKSSLLGLIPRFYDVSRGRVLVDGHDVRDLDLDDLRRSIGIVFQESFLFSNTVRTNIAFGHPEASDEQIVKAAKIAAAHDFIEALPDGYNTILREGGANLSGGQRQRLAIARAILLEPTILLLDDPTAAVDPQTEAEILQAMEGAMRGRSTFVIAHRLSTLRRADFVIVLDKGRIAQSGTHEELMAAPGFYRHAAHLQVADAESLRLLEATESKAS